MSITLKWLIATSITCVTIGASWAQEVDLGKQEYLRSCAVCHGTDGKGTGPASAALKKPAPSLTTLSKANGGVFPFSSVYSVIDGGQTVIAHGTREMPIWSYRFTPFPPYQPNVSDLYSPYSTYDPDFVVRARILAVIDYLNRIQDK